MNNFKTFNAIVAASIGGLLIALNAFAQTPATNAKKLARTSSPLVHRAPVYDLRQRDIAGTSPREFVWEIVRDKNSPLQAKDSPPPPQPVFKSLASVDLKVWVSHLPAGSYIEYNFFVSGFRSSTPVDFASVTKKLGMDDFTQYCKSQNVYFSFDVVAF